MRYFISGHRDLTITEFREHYVPLIQKIIKEDIWCEFVVGYCEGCDRMFVEWMQEHAPSHDILIFHCIPIWDKFLEQYPNLHFYKCNTYEDCDVAMTLNSDFDIAWVRLGRENSHTANNIRRRYGLNTQSSTT